MLSSFREYRGFSPLQLASQLNVPLSFYEELEEGKLLIPIEIAEKLEVIYNVPKCIFRNFRNESATNLNFNESPFNYSNGYVNNLYQNDIRLVNVLIATKDKEIIELKSEVVKLKYQNTELLNQILSMSKAILSACR